MYQSQRHSSTSCDVVVPIEYTYSSKNQRGGVGDPKCWNKWSRVAMLAVSQKSR